MQRTIIANRLLHNSLYLEKFIPVVYQELHVFKMPTILSYNSTTPVLGFIPHFNIYTCKIQKSEVILFFS